MSPEGILNTVSKFGNSAYRTDGAVQYAVLWCILPTSLCRRAGGETEESMLSEVSNFQ